MGAHAWPQLPRELQPLPLDCTDGLQVMDGHAEVWGSVMERETSECVKPVMHVAP